MEWLKELLKKAGLEESKLDSLIGDINKELPKHYMAKGLYNELAEAKKKLEGDLQSRDAQLEDLKKAAGASEELKKQIETLQADNKAAKEKYEADLKDLTLTNAIKLAVAGKVHDENLVAGLFDKSKLVIDGDKVLGLDDQLKGIQEQKAFLFKSAEGEQKPGFTKVGNDGKGTGTASNDQLAAIFGNIQKT